jgi:hypothetical protein
MSDTIIVLHGHDLPGLATEARNHELLRSLKDLATNSDKNYAVYKDPAFSPDTDLVILPAPAVGPAGSTEICDGVLTVGGQPVKVTAFRLAAA